MVASGREQSGRLLARAGDRRLAARLLVLGAGRSGAAAATAGSAAIGEARRGA